ncbi:DUF4136 domain-containing protein [Antarcticibacterium arcticum]|uniref:DUF4136 domain-containing protein n=1 Tax=Antarcticibacterium arcticum TaxID=2585771 RepID=A0A5B8YIV9_9FLAO|nr:DUF4136 domain-containing protein [Antarcticibacterium arcticum]QED37571.1 DUF4136 domain-containing protein [Antarcticibacterium arcticum]
MKIIKITTVLVLLVAFMTSCSSVRVASDYDQNANFSQYKTFAFFKPGIDKAEISDLDKRRILRAIENEMISKGFTKSEEPDLLVSIFTKTKENINIYQNNMFGYYGWGWNPWYWGAGGNTVNTTSEGTLYLDLIDAENKQLVWQGMGTAALAKEVNKKQERIDEIVKKILEKYPPGANR